VKKKAILISLMFGFAVAALLCVMCNDNGAGDANAEGYANAFVSKFNKSDTSQSESTYTLTTNISPDGSGSIICDPKGPTYTANKQVTVKAVADSGFVFKHWEGAATDITNSVKIMMDRDKELTAIFDLKSDSTYTLTVDQNSNTGGTVTRIPEGPNYRLNDIVTVTAKAKPGYEFKGWSGASTSKDSVVEIVMNGDTTLTAEFGVVIYQIKYDLDSGTVAGTNPNTYTIESASFKLINPTKDNYTFMGWTGTNGDTPEKDVTVTHGSTGDRNYAAHFWFKDVTPQTYKVTVSSTGVGATKDSSYAADATVFIYAGTAPTGQQFKNWTTSDGVTFEDSAKMETTFTMPATAVTVKAVFEPIPNTFIDTRDSTVYWTVKIGNQTWMAQNLNYEKDSSWCFNDDGSNCGKFGSLYNWKTANNVCPEGWHLPSRDEWGKLATFAGGTGNYGEQGSAGTILKSTTGWYNNKTGGTCNGTDGKEFSATPGGYRDANGYFNPAKIVDGFWWSSTEVFDDPQNATAYSRGIYCNSRENMSEDPSNKANGLSVRCVQGPTTGSKKRISK
jgi:uncharacterized protein (TIGR02145 family)/uncharacterized repeat protein (TIGR02543 family)